MTATPPRLRPVTEAEAPQLAQLAHDAFVAAFAAQNTEADLAAYVQKAFAPEQVRVELAHPANQFFWLEVGPELAGYCKLNFHEQPKGMPNAHLMKISRFYLLPGFVGRPGLAQFMLDQALEVGRRAHRVGAWLSVWQENPRAIRFYEKNGFATFGTTQFEMGQSVQQDFMMVRLF
jgi:ribosomal protein S18 acetylase RimI-like enzyme